MMQEEEIGSVQDEESNQNDFLRMLGDVKPTPHPNNNRKAPGKLKYEFECLCGMRIQ
jgi:hypothetical protein